MTRVKASDTVQYSSDGVVGITETGYTKKKELTISSITGYIGSWRIYFELRNTDGAPTEPVYGKIYKNGVAYGIEQNTVSNGFEAFTQDFTDINILNGDLIQIYCKIQTVEPGEVENFRIEFDNDIQSNLRIVQDTTDDYSLSEHNSWGVQIGLPLPQALRAWK